MRHRDRPAPALVPGRPPRWQRRLRRHRQVLSALLAALVVGSLASSLRPPTVATEPVVVSRTALTPGARVGSADVVLEQRPIGSFGADAARSVDDVAGRLVAAPVLADEVVRSRDVVGPSLLASLGDGLVAVPVRLDDDGVAALLHPGDLVDVVAARVDASTGSSAAEVVAAQARVLVVPEAGTGGTGMLGSGGSSAAGSLVVVATTPSAALAIGRARAAGRIGVVWRG